MYIPSRGDLVWLNFSPQSGHEQSGERPAIVISPYDYNKKTGLGLFCPVTNSIKGYPFEVPIPADLKIKGVILADQVKCLDWKVRKARFACTLDSSTIEEVMGKLYVLFK